MSTDPGQDNDAESGVARWKVEALVAALLFGLGAVVAFKSWQLGAGWREDGPGPGYFPFYIGLLICLATGVVFAGAMRGRGDGELFVTRPQLKLVLTVFWPSLAFVVVVQVLGLYVGSLLFIAAFMVLIGRYGWGKSLLVGAIVMVLAFLLFEVWFKVPLFKGWLHPLRFLGY
jgi:Tripartite tricarboxylate transporter TctB family